MPMRSRSSSASPSGQPQMMYRDSATHIHGSIFGAQAGTSEGCSFMYCLTPA